MFKSYWARVAMSVTGAVAMIVVGGCSTPHGKDVTKPTVQSNNQVIKSPSDDKRYRYLTLSSGLKVLLISNPDTDKAAAAVSVGVGSFNDPENRLGLAHFLEHMLFLGNKKYPKVDGYAKYIQANGGGANAYTADTQTNFFFDINSNKLRPALDQLAQFFVSPTLDPKYVDRERHAVDSEYKLHAREDAWRLSTALDATSNPAHPKSRFTIGNLETLNNKDNKSLWRDLKTFYDKYYVADNISVVVYGKESIDTLEKWVHSSFKDIPSHKAPDTHISIPPYTAKQLGVRINMVPLKDVRVLSLNFPLESTFPYYKQKPLNYLSRIIGYEGKGSLHSLLKNQGLINSLSAYSDDVPNEYAKFIVRMELTPKGLKHVDQITATVFDYLNLVRDKGITERLYNESRDIARNGFRFQEESSPQQTVSTLAGRMHHLPPENILNVSYLYEKYDPKLIRHFLDEMTPDNLRQVVIAQGLKTDKVEPYFGTHYSVTPLTASLKKRLDMPQKHTGLTIPAANTFIAKDFTLRSGSTLLPERIIHKSGIDVWNMTDTSFSMPRATVNIQISSPIASNTPENLISLQLYSALLNWHLNEYGYPAQEAGLFYDLSTNREGLEINLSGYQDKQKVLLQDILTGIKTFKPDPLAFEQEKSRIIRKLRNKAFVAPYLQGLDALNKVIYRNYPSDEVWLKAAQSITFTSLEKYTQTLYDHIHIDMLIHGNNSKKEAQNLGNMVGKALLTKDNAAKKYSEPYNLLGNQSRILQLNLKHNDALFIEYFQRPETDNYTRAQFGLLAILLATPFFNSLRTDQQLGYIVYEGARSIEKHPGIIFIVQSPKTDPIEIEKRVHIFLEQQVKRFNTLTESELQEYRQGLIGRLLQRDENLDARSNRLWQNIDNNEPFNNREAIAKEVKKLTVADMQKALAILLADKGRLIIRSFGQGMQAAKATETDQHVCRNIKCFDDLPHK
ncbi:MAG: insulinase family protein [Endozoicomonas sp. (ex Botrylloides leachii)]|nr:insulinase family protein [Endozoicomonas sp. (ex Botrylloides leachii)]